MSGESRNPHFCVLAALLLAWAGFASGGDTPTPSVPELRPPSPPVFAMPAPARARVVMVEDAAATAAYKPQPEVLRRMVDRGLTNLTGKPTPEEAWRSLVSTQDTVGIKVLSTPGRYSGTRPAVVEALVSSLLTAGHPPARVVIWDKQMLSLRQAGFEELAARQGVRVAAAVEAGYDTNEFYENAILGQLVHGDLEFELRRESLGRRSYVSRLVTSGMTKIISVTPLLNHNQTSVSGHLMSLALGSVDNTLRFTGDPGRLAVAVPEICALPILGDRVVLNVTDALLAQYYGEERTLLHYAAVLNQLWFSTDPVALDVLAVHELERQRELADMPAVKPNLALYQNASLVQIGVSDVKQIIVEWVR